MDNLKVIAKKLHLDIPEDNEEQALNIILRKIDKLQQDSINLSWTENPERMGR